MNEKFFEAIQMSRIIEAFIHTREHGFVFRKCVPFYYWESKYFKDGKERFHMFDLSNPFYDNHLSVLPEQLIYLEVSQENFEPLDFYTHKQKWIAGKSVKEID